MAEDKEDTVKPVQDDDIESGGITLPVGTLDPSVDPDSIVDLYALSNEQFIDYAENYIKKIGEPLFAKRYPEAGTYENLLARRVSDVVNFSTLEVDRVLRFLDTTGLKHDATFNTRLLDEKGKTRIGTASIYNPTKTYASPLSGRQGLMNFKSRKKGVVKRIPLLSSGISVLMMAPNISDVISFVDRVQAEEISYGRDNGVQYYSFADFVLKRQMIDFIIDLVLDSSLKNWSDDDRKTLLDTIRLTDFNALVLHVASMMYSQGYKHFQLECYNPNCDHITESMTADLSKFVNNRFYAMPEECIKFLEANKKASNSIEPKELIEYNKQLGFDGKVIEIGEYRYTFKVPTLQEYLDVGSMVVADIVAATQGSTSDIRYMTIASRNILTYLPWIAKIETLIFDDEDDTVEPQVQMECTELDLMRNVLLDIANDSDAEEQLHAQIEPLMDNAQLSLVCYATGECPACGQLPPTKSGMVTLDPVTAFFTQAYWLVKRHFARKAAAWTRSDSSVTQED